MSKHISYNKKKIARRGIDETSTKILHSILKKYPIIPCNLCGSQPQLQRQAIKELLINWEQKFPNRKAIMLNALKNVSPSHLLDTELFNFLDLETIKDDSHLVI